MSVALGLIYPRPALCLGYTNQSLLLETSLGPLLPKPWLRLGSFSRSAVRTASYAHGSGSSKACASGSRAPA